MLLLTLFLNSLIFLLVQKIKIKIQIFWCLLYNSLFNILTMSTCCFTHLMSFFFLLLLHWEGGFLNISVYVTLDVIERRHACVLRGLLSNSFRPKLSLFPLVICVHSLLKKKKNTFGFFFFILFLSDFVSLVHWTATLIRRLSSCFSSICGLIY